MTASAFVLDLARAAGRMSRDLGEPRESNPLADAERRSAWFSGWDVRDDEIEDERKALADEATDKARDALPDGAGGGS